MFPVFIALFWIVIYGLRYSSKRPLLPHNLARESREFLYKSRKTNVTLNRLHLQVQTSALSLKHDQLCTQVARKHHLRAYLTYFYNAGAVLGVIGQLGAIGLLVWTCTTLVKGFIAEKPAIQKRSLEEPTVQAIIPGVTVPLSDHPVILVTLFISQAIHELGHALAAAIDNIPLISVGASLTVAIPSAFVVLSASALQSAKSIPKLRIITSGAWHNLILWLVVFGSSRAGLPRWIIAFAGYQNISPYGQGVVGIEASSALRGALPIGSLITKVDDQPLSDDQNVWRTYLTSRTRPRSQWELGWCTDKPSYMTQPQQCCSDASSPIMALLSCFTTNSPEMRRCLDPLPILTRPADNPRCRVDADCTGDNTICIRTDPAAHLVRLAYKSVWNVEGPVEQIVLWHGPRQEIYEQVEVGSHLPRIPFFPLWFPQLVYSFFIYLEAVTLSLFAFNLLPLPYLDGAQLLDVLLDMTLAGPLSVVYNDLETGSQMIESRETGLLPKRRIAYAVKAMVSAIFIVTASLGLGKLAV